MIKKEINKISSKNKLENINYDFWKNKLNFIKNKGVDNFYDEELLREINKILNNKKNNNDIISFFYRDITYKFSIDFSSMKNFKIWFNNYFFQKNPINDLIYSKLEKIIKKYMIFDKKQKKWNFIKENNQKKFKQFFNEVDFKLKDEFSDLGKINIVEEIKLKINSKNEKIAILDNNKSYIEELDEFIKESKLNNKKIIYQELIKNKNNNKNKNWDWIKKNKRLEIKKQRNLSIKKNIELSYSVDKKLIGISSEWKEKLISKNIYKEFVKETYDKKIISDKLKEKFDILSKINNEYDFNKNFKIKSENENILKLKEELKDKIGSLIS